MLKPSDIKTVTRAVDHGIEVAAEIRLLGIVRIGDVENTAEATKHAIETLKRGILHEVYGEVRVSALALRDFVLYNAGHQIDRVELDRLLAPLLNAASIK